MAGSLFDLGPLYSRHSLQDSVAGGQMSRQQFGARCTTNEIRIMQLKRLHLENFQCIAGPTTIEFAPLTLLYGQNSSGKSAIGDALELLAQALTSKVDPSLLSRWTRANRSHVRVGIGYEIRADQLANYLDGAGLRETVGPNSAWALDIEGDRAYWALTRLIEPAAQGKENSTAVDVTLEISKTWGLTEASIIIDGQPLICVSEAGRYIDINLSHQRRDGLKNGLTEVLTEIEIEVEGFEKELPLAARQYFLERRGDHIRLKYLFEPFDEFGLRHGFSRDSNGSRIDMFTVLDTDYKEDLEDTESILQRFLGDNLTDSQSRCLENLRWFLHGLLVSPARLGGAIARAMVRVGPLRQVPREDDLSWIENKDPLSRQSTRRFYELKDEESRIDYRLIPPLESWFDGLEAWRYLAFYPHLLDSVNELLDDDVIGVGLGYSLASQRFELKPAAPDKWSSTELKMIPAVQPKDSPPGMLSAISAIRTIHVRDSSLDIPLALADVGSGISQVVPVLAALAKNQIISFIEQPELHLHTRAQSKLGSALYDHIAIQSRHHHPTLVVETHSEHIALRILRRLRERAEDESSVSSQNLVVFYYLQRKGDRSEVHRIRVDSAGRFVDGWPEGFFEERLEDLGV